MKSTTIKNREIFYYPSSDPVIQYLEKGILYGESNFNFLKTFIIDEGVIVDCGGHIGTFALPASSMYDVICIEAADKNFECLQKTFENSKKVTLVNKIISDCYKKCGFSSDYGPFGTITDGGNQVSAPLSDIVGDRTIAGIKIDIEGGEIDCLYGGESVLIRDKPPILIEVNGHCLRLIGKKPKDLFDAITCLGYEIFHYDHNKGRYYEVDKNNKWPFCVTDVICIHEDKLHNYPTYYLPPLDKKMINEMIKVHYQYSNKDCMDYFDYIAND